ncbi:Aspartate/glutamate/uridylate kinase [Xylariaceae sp. FL0255]|nr:Aspartate/glutamate/uridylate kinase [Xylariaceae sp. FL0255]
MLGGIEDEHMKAVQEYITCPNLADELIREVRDDCQRVRDLLSASRTLGEMTVNCLETIVSMGEKLSAKVLCGILKDRGIEAEYLDLSKTTTSLKKHVSQQQLYTHVSQKIAAQVRAHDAQVLVVTGYFGQVPGGLLNVVGRGYTDLCAVLLASGLRGSELQVWKELDGLFTADPRRVRDARPVRTMSPEEATELTFYGSEVINPLAMEQAARKGIPIAVKGVM